MFALRESILSFGTGLVGGAWGTFFIARSVWQTAQAQVDDTDRYCAQLRSLHGAVDEEPPSRRVRARPVVAALGAAWRSGHRRAGVAWAVRPPPARAARASHLTHRPSHSPCLSPPSLAQRLDAVPSLLDLRLRLDIFNAWNSQVQRSYEAIGRWL